MAEAAFESFDWEDERWVSYLGQVTIPADRPYESTVQVTYLLRRGARLCDLLYNCSVSSANGSKRTLMSRSSSTPHRACPDDVHAFSCNVVLFCRQL